MLKRGGKKMLQGVIACVSTIALLAGCGGKTDAPVGSQEIQGSEGVQSQDSTQVSDQDIIRESPMLTELVEQGKLPALEERIPLTPKVTSLGAADAVFGGTMNLAFNGSTCAEYSWMNSARVVDQDGLGNMDELPYANVVESYEVNDDFTEFTFRIREGTKWSDGEPLTTEDVRFWWEDVMNNPEITPSIDGMWKADGELMQLDILDEYTFKCSFASSYLMFPWQLSLGWRSDTMFFIPSHYLKELHKDYADEAELKTKLSAANYSVEDWAQYFTAYGWGPEGPNSLTTAVIGCPVLTPFVVVEHPSANIWIAERNPYYWEVDEQGRQLPYVDRIRIEQVADTSMMSMKAMSGEVDYMREALSTADMPVLKENEQTGSYRAVPLTRHDAVYFNLNFGYDTDPGWAEIVNNTKFREALNIAIDRQTILSTLYLDQGQLSSHTSSEYDVERANALLDEIGMDQRDADGFRLRPDGTPFRIDFEYAKLGTEFSDFVEIIQGNWKEIGINMVPKVLDASLWSQKYESNDIQTRMLWCDLEVCEANPVMWDWSLTVRSSTKYTEYYNSNGKSGNAPEGDLLDIFKLTFQLKSAISVEELSGTWDEIKEKLYTSNIWFIPCENVVSPVVYSNRMHNTVEEGLMIESNMLLKYTYLK